MFLYHYTCSHQVDQIRETMTLRGLVHPLMPALGPLIHLTDLPVPDRNGLGLTSRILKCDRTEWRCTVDAPDVFHWPRFARLYEMPKEVREELESVPGVLPMHWYIVVGQARPRVLDIGLTAMVGHVPA